MQLDANMVLAPCNRETAKELCPELPELPLYSLSVEAKLRGDAPPHATLIWAEKQLEALRQK